MRCFCHCRRADRRRCTRKFAPRARIGQQSHQCGQLLVLRTQPGGVALGDIYNKVGALQRKVDQRRPQLDLACDRRNEQVFHRVRQLDERIDTDDSGRAFHRVRRAHDLFEHGAMVVAARLERQQPFG